MMRVVHCGKKCSSGNSSSTDAALLSAPASHLVIIPLYTSGAVLGGKKDTSCVLRQRRSFTVLALDSVGEGKLLSHACRKIIFSSSYVEREIHENTSLVDSWTAGDIRTRLYIGQKFLGSNLCKFLPKKHLEKT